ncbi:MAG: acylphosphatase [Methylocapsa sp.]|nr:acylphosphatase [Methylocapsa sp.]
MTKERKIVRVTVQGFVQGVGFRAWTQREAHRLGISGWVRNRRNGDVEAIFAGPRDAVEALCAACWRGPSHASVSGVHTEETGQSELEISDLASGFQLLETR